METRTAYELLGEMVLEEILVQAGIQQAHDPGGADIRVELAFVVAVDAGTDRVLVHGNRLGRPPLRIHLDVAPGGR